MRRGTRDKKYRKSDNTAGEVMGRYHPHATWRSMTPSVRMAQDFSMSLPLIDGQGNFGSIDGDPPAAMRYTESRLAKAASFLLQDIGEDTVDFRDNYDGERKSRPCCRRVSRTCWSMARAASPSAWRPTSRRTISRK
ncbi:MAG: DNA gyrase subunit A [Hyphomonadaceae bacterium]